MPHALDEIAPTLAKWLAPYVAAELGLAAPHAAPELSPDYDEVTAAIYIEGLGDPVVPRAEWFFRHLSGAQLAADDGVEDERRFEIDSATLAAQLRLDSPRQIAPQLTNSLKRRAKRLGLPYPWVQLVGKDDRTVWAARSERSARNLMVACITERERRGLPELFADEKGSR